MQVGDDEAAIERFPKDGTFREFFERYLMTNQPCLFDESTTREWQARKYWVTKGGTPNLDYLEDKFGSLQVPVADCSWQEFSTHPVSEMTLTDYITYWKGCRDDKGQLTTKLLYLKDWHFARDNGMEAAYTLPEVFSSDWLNEVWPLRQDVHDDYRFVYMGPAGTWTPLHADVFRSYSWSANVCGSKEWLLFPPGEEDKLRDTLGNLPVDITRCQLQDCQRYPLAPSSRPPLRVIQSAGEIIFVPSGWYHQVRNLEDTISINHNWTNVFGVRNMWTHLQRELQLVQSELSDVREMDGWDKQCQVVLKCSAGMDYHEFVQFLCQISLSRLSQLNSLLSTVELPLTWLVEMKSLVAKIVSMPWSFFPDRAPPVLMEHQQPADNLTAVLSSCSSCYQPPLTSEDKELLSSTLNNKSNIHLLLFRAYELKVIHSILQEINI